MTEKVLVTGGFGLVGSQTVRRLVADGHRVVATDLGTAGAAQEGRVAARRRGGALGGPDRSGGGGGSARGDRADRDHSPGRGDPAGHLSGRPNSRVGSTSTPRCRCCVPRSQAPVRRASSKPPVMPCTAPATRTATTSCSPRTAPVAPSDLYGAHKAEAEQHVRLSDLEWVILRLGGVMSVDPSAMPFTFDALFFESALPTDGRMHSVDVRDVATAFAAAATADVAGEILLVAGDESHRLQQGEVGAALAATRGLRNVLPGGRPGDPGSDEDWFVTDWMDTGRAQQALSFQHHSWPDMLAEMRAATGWRRYPMAAGRASCPAVTQAPRCLPRCAGALREPVERHPRKNR